MEKENNLSSMRCEGTQFSFAMENNKIEWIVHPFQQALIQGSSQTPSDHKTWFSFNIQCIEDNKKGKKELKTCVYSWRKFDMPISSIMTPYRPMLPSH